MKRSQPKRDWTDARAKVEEEGRCRVHSLCVGPLDAAHIIGRKHDKPKTPGSKTLYVHPDSIVPACRKHHQLYDAHQLDLLGLLSVLEEARAVVDAGGLENARVRLCPSEYRKVAA